MLELQQRIDNWLWAKYPQMNALDRDRTAISMIAQTADMLDLPEDEEFESVDLQDAVYEMITSEKWMYAEDVWPDE